MPTSDYKMKPLILKGHDRPLSQILFNRQGDLLFSTSKGKNPTVWFTDNGERGGTFDGHTGAVVSLDVDFDSTRLITGSGDHSTRLWDVQTGTELYQWKHPTPVRYVNWALGNKLFLSLTDAVLKNPPYINIYRLEDDLKDQKPEPLLFIKGDQINKKITYASFGPLNESIYATGEQGEILVFDTETGKEINKIKAHQKEISAFKFSNDQMRFVTGSKDHNSKLWDTRSLECIKTYVSGRPIYDVAISPNTPHLLVSTGQEVSTVATTEADQAQFRVRVFHMVHETEIASIGGHFSPVNTLAFSQDGRLYASGGEDGFVRLHHLGNALTEGLSDQIVFPINTE